MGYIGIIVVLILGTIIFFQYPFSKDDSQRSAPDHAIGAAESVKGIMDARTEQTEAALKE